MKNQTKVTETSGSETTYAYDGMGRVTEMYYPNGWVEYFTYDKMGRILAFCFIAAGAMYIYHKLQQVKRSEKKSILLGFSIILNAVALAFMIFGAFSWFQGLLSV